MTCTVVALLWPWLMCYYATIATDRIESLGHNAYDSNWYDYPAKLRKHIVLIIVRSQEQVIFTGLNLMGCTLEVFGMVIFCF